MQPDQLLSSLIKLQLDFFVKDGIIAAICFLAILFIARQAAKYNKEMIYSSYLTCRRVIYFLSAVLLLSILSIFISQIIILFGVVLYAK